MPRFVNNNHGKSGSRRKKTTILSTTTRNTSEKDHDFDFDFDNEPPRDTSTLNPTKKQKNTPSTKPIYQEQTINHDDKEWNCSSLTLLDVSTDELAQVKNWVLDNCYKETNEKGKYTLLNGKETITKTSFPSKFNFQKTKKAKYYQIKEWNEEKGELQPKKLMEHIINSGMFLGEFDTLDEDNIDSSQKKRLLLYQYHFENHPKYHLIEKIIKKIELHIRTKAASIFGKEKDDIEILSSFIFSEAGCQQQDLHVNVQLNPNESEILSGIVAIDSCQINRCKRFSHQTTSQINVHTGSGIIFSASKMIHGGCEYILPNLRMRFYIMDDEKSKGKVYCNPKMKEIQCPFCTQGEKAVTEDNVDKKSRPSAIADKWQKCKKGKRSFYHHIKSFHEDGYTLTTKVTKNGQLEKRVKPAISKYFDGKINSSKAIEECRKSNTSNKN
ncbi:predicted protein [Chaetoceros tenuissimus]|uniref:Uncharacterized protein n=1 Tax=Chaetoceros tenuissimus TaxID=426638 RepID=A0AAD3H8X3_9STRA|nr:predicted protein [Chaetoceros tenuissimus]